MRVLIAGGGQVGTMIASRLIREGNEVTIVEEDGERCTHLDDVHDAKIVSGTAASIRTLERAGARHADMLIAVTSSDEVNLLSCLIAQTEYQVRVKVARIRTHEVDHWRRIAAASGLKIDLMIHPESEAAGRMLPVLQFPGVTEIVDFAEGRVKLFGMIVRADSWVAGKTVMDLDQAGPPKNSLIAMIFRAGQVIIPHGAQVIEAEDQLYIICRTEDLEDAIRFMGLPPRRKIDRAFILGGKQLGIRVAEDLEKSGVDVKLFEVDQRRCEKIAGLLEATTVIHGDGTDAETLTEENIAGASVYLALTNHDEQNLIAAMLARRLGARKVVALMNRVNYMPLAQRLGINTSISPRLVTVDRILQFVRKGRVVSVTTFGEEAAEAIELEAAAGSRYVDRPLRDVRLPREVVVGAVVRPNGVVIVPRGNDAIHSGDRVIFFTQERLVPDLENAFLTTRKR